MSRLKALLKFVGAGALIGLVVGFISARAKYGTGIIDILEGNSGWGGYEELGVPMFWGFFQAGIFFAIVAYVVTLFIKVKTGKTIKEFLSKKF